METTHWGILKVERLGISCELLKYKLRERRREENPQNIEKDQSE